MGTPQGGSPPASSKSFGSKYRDQSTRSTSPSSQAADRFSAVISTTSHLTLLVSTWARTLASSWFQLSSTILMPVAFVKAPYQAVRCASCTAPPEDVTVTVWGLAGDAIKRPRQMAVTEATPTRGLSFLIGFILP